MTRQSASGGRARKALPRRTRPGPLSDQVRPGVRVLFVGINPGIRSAKIGHHFAGYSNRFWKLLYESGLVPERIGPEEDGRLPEWGLGITNLVARPTPGIGDLRAADYKAGRRALLLKIRRFRPGVVALTGVTLHRALFPGQRRQPVSLWLQQDETLAGARVFVLPNPSGRNANFSYADMLAAFRALRACISGL
jgi:TDG/mug DNA glycosylase family protein